MEIFFLMPRSKNRIIFLFEWKNIIFQGDCVIDKSMTDRVEISAFPIDIDSKTNFLITESDMHTISTEFLNFLFNNREKAKLGSFLKDTDNLYKYVLKKPQFLSTKNELHIRFDIYDISYTLDHIKVLKTKDDIQFLLKEDSFLHHNTNCGCEEIKKDNDILIDSCLFCVEHEDFIYDWLLREYKKELRKEDNTIHTNVIPFHKKK